MSETENKQEEIEQMEGMVNDEDEIVELYIPRKCSFTNRVLSAKDKASIQFDIGEVNEDGNYTGNSVKTIALSGFLRNKGKSAAAIEKMLKDAGILPI